MTRNSKKIIDSSLPKIAGEIGPADTRPAGEAAASLKPNSSPAKEEEDRPILGLASSLEPVKFIAWLGASAGGLTILLAVIGFLALGAHDAMLGIPKMFLAQQEYVSVGALFFSRSIMYVVAALILQLQSFNGGYGRWMTVAALLIIISGLFYLVRRGKLSKYYIASITITLAPIIVFVGELYVLYRLTVPLQITNLLLQFTDLASLASSESSAPTQPILRALINGDQRVLQSEYGVLALLVLCSGIFYQCLEWVHQSGKDERWSKGGRANLWRWLRTPVFVLLLISFFLLPRAYGVLTITNEYPMLGRGPNASQPEIKDLQLPLFQLRESEKSLVLYDPCAQAIISLKRDTVEQLKISAPKNIFLYQSNGAGDACKRNGTPPTSGNRDSVPAN